MRGFSGQVGLSFGISGFNGGAPEGFRISMGQQQGGSGFSGGAIVPMW